MSQMIFKGFLRQKPDFEILIYDEAPKDKTADIIREYKGKYPNINKPVYQSKNQHKKRVGLDITFKYLRARGKYIALGEGDDF